MKSDILLDTNILVYALDSSNAYHEQAKNLLNSPDFNFIISTKNISEYFAICSKLNVPISRAIMFYSSLRENCQVIFPGEASLLIFEQLIQKYQPRGNRVFDMEIISIALANGISQIATVNSKDFEEVKEIAIYTLK
jgi:predicted nucleic acid-binding protein